MAICILMIILCFAFRLLRSLAAGSDAPYAKGDEWKAQNLSHIYRQSCFESHLNLLRVFYEEAEDEDEGKAKTEIESATHTLGSFLLVDEEDEEEEAEIGYRLVELTGMAWVLIFLDEDECPRHISYLADDFGVHQVAQADEAGGDA